MIYPGLVLGRRGRAAARHPWSRRKLIKTAVVSFLAGVLAVAAAVGLYITWLMIRLRPTLPTAAQIAAFRPSEGTSIYSSDGVLLARLQTENRQVVPLKAIARPLIDATIAVEDSRFYEHGGIDVRGVARAFWADLCGRDATAQGGSTITQQLARNVTAFHVGKEKNLPRKLREAMTALRIEQVFRKDDILALYLNQVYYGGGAWGVEAASRAYFGKHASQLDLAESALLAGLPQRPAAYSPLTNPDAATRRRHVVLTRMLDTGKITPEQLRQADAEPVRLAPRKAAQQPLRAPYFVDWVVQSLVDRYGTDAVYSGWGVVTTLNWHMQKEAEQDLRSGLRYGATQGALVSIDPHTGYVRAMVGGVDHKRDQFNVATQGRRQPGSAFKIFVYTAALDSGSVDLDTTFKDAPLTYQVDHRRTWTVHNYGGGYTDRDRTVLDGITHSVNTVAVQAALQVGLENVAAYAHRMGITTELPPYPSLALGSAGVRPIELCSAISMFADDGDRYVPTGVLRVRDNEGRVLMQDDPQRRRVPAFLHPTTLQAMALALREVVLHGTGTAAAGVPWAFGKTGTTNDQRDAWFAGFTPQLATVVWVGHPHRGTRRQLQYLPMPGATGGRLAAPIWARFMGMAVPLQRRINRAWRVGPYAVAVPPLPETQTTATTAPGAPEQVPQTMGSPLAAGQTPWQQVRPSPPGPAMWTPPVGATVMPGSSEVQQPPRAASPAPSAQSRADGGADGYARSRDAGLVTVRVCAESGLLATEWCPTTILVRMPASQAPREYCRLHRAPPGE